MPGGKLRRSQCEHMSSELSPKADMARYGRHVANVPIWEVTTQFSLSSCSLALLRSGVLNPSVNHS
jgi:hypothetical protein